MTLAPRPGDEATAAEGLVCTYDAWNRLVAVYADTDEDHDGVGDAGDTPVAEYRYDGLGRRVRKIDKTGESDVTYDYYYSGYQVVEVRKDADADPLKQYVWGLRYVHSPVLRWRDENTDGQNIETLYYCNDANFNVTALVETDGDIAERVVYDPYGKPTFYDSDWANPASTSAYANEILFTGHRLDPETGLYHTPYRTYHPTLGRWLQRDPVGYVDGMGLYEYARCCPAHEVDPYGLVSGDELDELLLDAGRIYKEYWKDWSYGADAMTEWLKGRGGTYRGNEQMRRALAESPAIKSKLKDLTEKEILNRAQIDCDQRQQMEFEVNFGTRHGEPIEFRRNSQLVAIARKPDRIECYVVLDVVLECSQGEEARGCCEWYDYAGLAMCRLYDWYDFHNPRTPNGEWVNAYKNKSWEEKKALEWAWNVQEHLSKKPMRIDVWFKLGLWDWVCKEQQQ